MTARRRPRPSLFFFVLSLFCLTTNGFSFTSRNFAQTNIALKTAQSHHERREHISQAINFGKLSRASPRFMTLKAQASKETKEDQHREINLDWPELQKQASLFIRMAMPYFKYDCHSDSSRPIADIFISSFYS
jgi:hypothetical protein